jgi:hypothetical protein
MSPSVANRHHGWATILDTPYTKVFGDQQSQLGIDDFNAKTIALFNRVNHFLIIR